MRYCLLFLMLLFASTISAQQQNALDFDGTSDYVQTNYQGILGGSTPITVEAWIRTSGSNGEKVITAWGTDTYQGGRFTFRVNVNVIRIENKGGGVDGTINVKDGNWHHVAVTYDPIATYQYKLYVDGVLDTQGNIAAALNIGAGVNMRIGRRIHTTYTGFFDGTIDEVRVWNVARTQSELSSYKDQEISPVPSSLVAYYKFNQGVAGGNNSSVTTLLDEVSSNNNGTLLTFALTGSTSNWITGKNLASVIITNQNIDICDGDSITVGNNTYTVSGSYSDTLTSSANTDSIVNTNLTVNPVYDITNDYDECQGFTITVGSNTYSTSGTYVDSLLTMTGCDSIITTNLTITVVDTSVSVVGVGLSATANADSYQWLDCNNGFAVINGANSQQFLPASNGSYAVQVIKNGCVDTSGCHSITSIGINDLDEPAMFKIYPNPNAGTFFIMTGMSGEEIQLNLYSLNGDLVISKAFDGNEMNGPRVSLQDLKNGVYYLELNSAGTTHHQKLVLIR